MVNKLKRAGSLFFSIGLILLAPGQSALAQGAISARLDSVDTGQYPKLTAYATVTDENGLPIAGLKADRFELIEDGQTSFPPEEVRTINNDKAAVSVLILIDLSGSMDGKPLLAAKEATARFLDKLLNEAGDPDQAAFIGFGRQVDFKTLDLTDEAREVPFTNDRGRLLNTANFVEVEPNTGTPLYDAVYRAVKITAQRTGRRTIIVMTDGRDAGSTLKDSDPIAEAQRQHIPIFPIGLSNSRLDSSYLKRLAELTGGQYQEAPAPGELGQKFADVLAQIKTQYVLTYSTRLPKTAGQYHSLALRVSTPRGQAFDEVKFVLGQPAPTLPTSSQPNSTPRLEPTSQSTASSTGDKGMFDFIKDNPLLAILVVGALVILAALVAVIGLMRRRAASRKPVWEAESYPTAEPGWPASASFSPQTGYGDQTASGSAPGSSPPTIGPGAQPGGPSTQKASDMAPTPGPFAAPQKPATPIRPPDGGTVIIQRGEKPKVLGFLVNPKQTSQRFDLDRPAATIGRDPGNTIVLDHQTVSRQHATIKLEGNSFRLFDLGSANGTFVNDIRVREPVTLEDGVVVRFGEVELTFKRLSFE